MSDWVSLGVKTVKPNDLKVVVGSFSIEQNDDAIWFKVTQTSPRTAWPWSFGVLSWETTDGRELGSVKAYTETAGEVVRLGVGRKPRQRTGSVIYEPRSFNLSWVKKGNPLTLSFAAASGTTAGVQTASESAVAFPVEGGRWLYQMDTGLVRLKL